MNEPYTLIIIIIIIITTITTTTTTTSTRIGKRRDNYNIEKSTYSIFCYNLNKILQKTSIIKQF